MEFFQVEDLQYVIYRRKHTRSICKEVRGIIVQRHVIQGIRRAEVALVIFSDAEMACQRISFHLLKSACRFA
jgi:hypothetical protein